jgi:hypothetical protein
MNSLEAEVIKSKTKQQQHKKKLGSLAHQGYE